jgi:hypothetical protein
MRTDRPRPINQGHPAPAAYNTDAARMPKPSMMLVCNRLIEVSGGFLVLASNYFKPSLSI